MALLKAHTAAKLAIVLNYCMAFIYNRPAVQWHWLTFKEKSQNVMGLICTWDGHRWDICPTVSILPFSSHTGSTQVFTSQTFLYCYRAPGQYTFPDIQHVLYSSEFTSFHLFYVTTLICLLTILTPEDLNCTQELVTR